MPREINKNIDVYIRHFKKLINRLRDYKLDEEDRILKKNILVSIIDAISRTTSNYNDGNRARFTSIIENFGDWENSTRVSAPHVGYLLKNLNSPSYEKARDFITQTISKNSDGSLIELSDDPKLEDLKKYWPVSAEQKLVNQLSLSSFTHLNLFYSYRNSLVHELREPGYGMEFHNEHESPFYHGLTSFDENDMNGESTLELVYPLKFYFSLTDNIIDNVEKYLRKNQINPYKSYSFGSSWLGELNI